MLCFWLSLMMYHVTQGTRGYVVMLVTEPVAAATYHDLFDRASAASCTSSVVNHFQLDDASIPRVDEMIDIGVEHSFLLNNVVLTQVPCYTGLLVLSIFANRTKIASWMPVLGKNGVSQLLTMP